MAAQFLRGYEGGRSIADHPSQRPKNNPCFLLQLTRLESRDHGFTRLANQRMFEYLIYEWDASTPPLRLRTY